MTEADGEDRKPQEFGAWREVFSSSGKIYYYNAETEVSQWEKPQEWKDHEEAQRQAAIEAERQRQLPIPPLQPPPSQFLPFPFPPTLPPPSFPFGSNQPLPPFPIPGTPGFVPPPPPIPPPRLVSMTTVAGPSRPPTLIPIPPIQLPADMTRNGKTTSQSEKSSPYYDFTKRHSRGSSFGQTTSQPSQPLRTTPTMPQTTFRPGPSAASQRFDRPDMPRPISRDEQKPHPYATPIPLRGDAPHPYRRDEPPRRPEPMQIQDPPKKREADSSIECTEAKRPARFEEEILQENKNPEPMSQEEEEPFMKYVDKESEAQAEALKIQLCLNKDQEIIGEHRTDSMVLNNKAIHSMAKVLGSRSYDIILSHDIKMIDIQIDGVQKRRKAIEENPIRPPAFETNDERIAWLKGRQEVVAEMCRGHEELRRELQNDEIRLIQELDDEEEAATQRMNEIKEQRRNELEKRRVLSEPERNKVFLELISQAEESLKKLERKMEDSRRALRTNGV